jgi:hypothetical protein
MDELDVLIVDAARPVSELSTHQGARVLWVKLAPPTRFALRCRWMPFGKAEDPHAAASTETLAWYRSDSQR